MPTHVDQTTLWSFVPRDSTPGWIRRDGLPTITVSPEHRSPDDTTPGPSGGTPWPALQPGPLDSSGGFIGHRIEVPFTVRTASNTVLELDFSSERGPCPDLEIGLDARHRGVFHPQVVREDRTQTGEPGPVAGFVHLEVRLPTAWLPVGDHVLTVTTVLDETAALGTRPGVAAVDALPQPVAAVDTVYEPSEELPEARAHYGHWFGAYIRWNQASLRAVTDPPEAEATGTTQVGADPAHPQATVRATPYYVEIDQKESELVDLDLTWEAGSPRPERVEIAWGGTSLTAPAVPVSRDFGSFRWRFPATALDGAVTMQTTVDGWTTTHEVTPCRRWTLHLIPHVHLDLGFTDSQGKVLELHCRNVDTALNLIDDDPDFRFCVDGSHVVSQFMATRSARQIERLHQAIEAGRLGVNAFHSNFLTGVVSLEELHRSARLGLTLPRSSTTHMRYANVTDVPTYSSAIPSVLAQHGVEGFVGISNHGRAATDTSDELHLLSPVRWRGPDGGEVLAHFSDQYSQLRFVCADPQAVAGAVDGLGRYLARYERADYLPSDLPVIGTHADNEDLADGDTGFVRRWNAAFAWPRIRVSTFDEYLAAVKPLAARLPLWQQETGSFWEDGVGSAAAMFSRYRHAQDLLPTAETLGALIAASSTTLRPHRDELDRAWSDLLIAAEHTLTWARSTSHPHAFPVRDQLEWKERYIVDAHRVATDEMRRLLAQLCDVMDLSGPGVLVWNPHPWTTDLACQVDLLEGTDLVDGAGVVEVEQLSVCGGMRRCRFTARQVEGHGWQFLPMTRGLQTLPGGEASPRPVEAASDPSRLTVESRLDQTIETSAWALRLDLETSLPVSLVHRATGRDLLDADAPSRLGQIVRAAERPFVPTEVDGGLDTDRSHDHHRARTYPIENFRYVEEPALSDLLLESPQMHLWECQETFDGTRLRWRGAGAGLDAVVIELLLPDTSETCELGVRFTKQASLDMEAVYVSFPFAGENPVVRYDRQLGWVRPAVDHGPGASNEWGALTNAVSVDTDRGEVVWCSLDAPLFTTGDIVRGVWPTTYVDSNAHLYSSVMNNFWPCNTPPEQPGIVSFTYQFTATPGFDEARSGRLGRLSRLGGQAVEILPLDRFRPGTVPTFRAGSLVPGVQDGRVDVQWTTQPEGDAIGVWLTNLTGATIDVRVPVPEGFEPPDGRSSTGHVTAHLGGFESHDDLRFIRRTNTP